MTNKERIRKVFGNEPVDRVPVGFWFHFLNEGEFDQGLSDPSLFEKNLAGHERFIKQSHPDFVKIMSDGFFYYPIETGDGISEPSGLSAIQALPGGHPWVERQVDLVKAVSALQGGTSYFYNIFSPAISLQAFLGNEKFIEFYKADPAAVSGALNRMSEGLATLAGRVMGEGGADGVYFSARNPDSGAISTESYNAHIKPSEVSLLNAANRAGGYNILHICGYAGNRNDLNIYRDYPAGAFNWAVHVEGTGLAEGKRLFGGKAVIGGFDNRPGSLIHAGSRGGIEAYAEKLIAEAGAVGVALGADCTVPSGIGLQRLEWVRGKAASLSGL